MKWLSFFVILILMVSCKNKKEQKQPVIPESKHETKQPVSYNDTVTMPFRTEKDSGYFKGYIPDKIDELEVQDSSYLSQYLSKLISTREIVLLNDETLSHSVFIDQKARIRYDTLKNKLCTITSIIFFYDEHPQEIKINNDIVKNCAGPGGYSAEDLSIDFDRTTFRYFSFKGNEYYYIQAGAFFSEGGSIINLTYHFVYSIKNKQLNSFETCRFNQMLFGNVNGDDQLDYLDFNNSDFCTGVPYSDNVIIQLYSCDKKGKFILQKDKINRPYFIEGATGNPKDEYTQDSFSIEKYKWPKPL